MKITIQEIEMTTKADVTLNIFKDNFVKLNRNSLEIRLFGNKNLTEFLELTSIQIIRTIEDLKCQNLTDTEKIKTFLQYLLKSVEALEIKRNECGTIREEFSLEEAGFNLAGNPRFLETRKTWKDPCKPGLFEDALIESLSLIESHVTNKETIQSLKDRVGKIQPSILINQTTNVFSSIDSFDL